MIHPFLCIIDGTVAGSPPTDNVTLQFTAHGSRTGTAVRKMVRTSTEQRENNVAGGLEELISHHNCPEREF